MYVEPYSNDEWWELSMLRCPVCKKYTKIEVRGCDEYEYEYEYDDVECPICDNAEGWWEVKDRYDGIIAIVGERES